MKENKFDTVKKAGNKNSIEEDITRVKQRIEDIKEYIEYGLSYSEYLDLENSFDNILSDYKRVLKENEKLKYKVEGQECVIETQAHNEEVYERIFKRLEKENEELKQDKNDNYQMIALAQNEMLGYMQGYEDGKKLNRSAVACVVENQQYYIIKKEIEHYKEYIEKLQKENEKFKKERQIVGMPVRNKRDGRIGIVLHQWESGSVSVLESINPRVINTHDSWNTLEIVTDGVKQDNNDTNVGSI